MSFLFRETSLALKVVEGIVDRDPERTPHENKRSDVKGYSRARYGMKYNSKFVNKRNSGEAYTNMDYCVAQGENKEGDHCQDDLDIFKKGRSTTLALFDGHGTYGHNVSKSCVYFAERVMKKMGEETCDLASVIEEIDRRISKVQNLDSQDSGTTGTLVRIKDKKMEFSWVGDSKAVIFVASQQDYSDLVAIEVTRDHDLRSDEEKSRVNNAGGLIIQDELGHQRVVDPKYKEQGFPGLMMSKSIGDLGAKNLGCDCKADYKCLDFEQINSIGDLYREMDMDTSDELLFTKPITHLCLIVASDGLWNAMKLDEVSTFIEPLLRTQSNCISTELMLEAKHAEHAKRGPSCYVDDISIISLSLC